MGEYTVYKHTSPSGKVYVGITKQPVKQRWHGGRGYIGNPAFWNAIQKYGWDNFEHVVLETGLSPEEASEKERFYIAHFRSLNTQNGYNIDLGGVTRYSLSEESRRKISESRRGKKMPPMSEERRKRLSEALTGRIFSEEHRKHIRESKLGVYAGKNNPRARKVRCVETGVIFETIKDAGVFIGGSPKNIVSCCRGRLKTSGGFHWCYVDEEV